MNPFLLWTAFSFRKELMYVASVFVLVLALPIIAVMLLTQTGINIVSDKLATVNALNQTIEILNPLDGTVVKTITAKFIWPTQGRITLEFGQADLPYQPLHTGIDIAGKRGNPIAAFADGKVIYAGEISWGFGKHIIIDNGNNITSIYAHLDKIYVAKDEKVTQGQIIGAEGSTGWSTGPHLHFQVNVFGIPVNPRKFLSSNLE